MNRKEVFEELTAVFADVLGLQHVSLNDGTTVDDIEAWDSLSHIHLVVAIENRFHVRFTSREIMRWQNVGEMVDTIIRKL